MQEGWSPATFHSSRGARSAAAQQQVSDFLDEDERAELEAKSLRAGAAYDTFSTRGEAAAAGTAQAEAVRRHGETALALVPQEALRPAALGVGMQLLQRMGWRPVRSAPDGHDCCDASAGGVVSHVRSAGL